MQKTILALITTLAPFTFTLEALAQGPIAGPFITHQLRPNVYYVEGGGGHSGVIIGDNGVIVIDAKPRPTAARNCSKTSRKLCPSR